MKRVTPLRRILIWIIVLGLVSFLLSTDAGRKRAWNPVEQFIIEITAPFQVFIRKTVDMTEGFWTNYFLLINVRRENIRLRSELSSLRMENSRYRELMAAHKRLQGLLKFKQTIRRPVVAAEVIGRDPTGWFKSVIIDKGTLSGIRLDFPVVNDRGVVGRIVSVSPNYAKALLIIDQNSAVDCLVQRSRDRGMVKGLSGGTCKLDYMVNSSDVTPGDTVVTSGLGGVFPKGLPIGEVLKVREVPGALFKQIQIRPAVEFSKLEEVLVILKKKVSLSQQKEEK